MRIEGRMLKDKGSKYWAVEVPILNVFTQGESVQDAMEMARDAVGLLLEDHTDGAVNAKDIEIYKGTDGHFELGTRNTKALSTLILRQLRSATNLSLAEVAARLGTSSRNAIGQYEEGKSEPGLAKLQEILGAYGLDLKLSVVSK